MLESKTYCRNCVHEKICEMYSAKRWGCVEFTPTVDVPDINVEKLTDAEQRIFLAAIGREEMVCKKVDIEMKCQPCEISLVSVCEEIRRKVKKVLW